MPRHEVDGTSTDINAHTNSDTNTIPILTPILMLLITTDPNLKSDVAQERAIIRVPEASWVLLYEESHHIEMSAKHRPATSLTPFAPATDPFN